MIVEIVVVVVVAVGGGGGSSSSSAASLGDGTFRNYWIKMEDGLVNVISAIQQSHYKSYKIEKKNAIYLVPSSAVFC